MRERDRRGGVLQITDLFERRYLNDETSDRNETKGIWKGRVFCFSQYTDTFDLKFQWVFHGRLNIGKIFDEIWLISMEVVNYLNI